MTLPDAARRFLAPLNLRRLFADLIKYGAASALALALDFTILMFFYRIVGVNHLLAAAMGFLSGLTLIYLLSVRYVFADRRKIGVGGEIAGFLISGVMGLALTEVLMHFLVDNLALPVAFAKFLTAGVVFLFNFSTRRSLIFAQGKSENDAR